MLMLRLIWGHESGALKVGVGGGADGDVSQPKGPAAWYKLLVIIFTPIRGSVWEDVSIVCGFDRDVWLMMPVENHVFN